MALNDGDKVRIHYTGKLDNGETFDSSAGREPLEFVVGSGRVIPGFDAGVRDMEVGGKKNIRIVAAQAYGPRREENVIEVPASEVPPHIKPEVGMTLELRSQDGGIVPVTITEVTEKSIRLDGNHPLAGEALNFELELVSVG